MKQCHFIGIGGIGMSGLARILMKKKVKVTGSDQAESYVTEGLKKGGAEVFIGHSSSNISADSTVVYTTGVNSDNPEYKAALSLKCPMMHRSDLLAHLMQGHKSIAVAGTHGKTTVTALLSVVLHEAGFDPSYAVGGIVKQYNTNAAPGAGEFFVAEADESDGTFLKYHPFAAIVTNIDLDHMNHFLTESALIDAFGTFCKQVSSSKHLFWCGEDERLTTLKPAGISYGFSADCGLRASNIRQQKWHLCFDVDFQGKQFRDIKVALIGPHNVLNALSVFGMAITLGVSENDIRKALENFGGVGRRCDVKGEVQNVLIIDDYAHHPTEIATTLKGLREAIEERRLIALYQPHRYSRTQDCLGTFGGIFDEVDELWITDIFGAGEKPIAGVSAQKVLEEIRLASPSLPVKYASRLDLENQLFPTLRPHDVVVTVGAGDITKLGGDLVVRLSKQSIKKIKVGLIYGGRSVEHDVSLSSSEYISKGLSQSCYDVAQFGITKQGHWITGDNIKERLKMSEGNQLLSSNVLEQLLQCDILFPILHGTYGEDGTMQGFFEILGKPYVGCDFRSAAICMDKVITKRIAESAGVRILPFISFTEHEWKSSKEQLFAKIETELAYPLFVKPSHLGSSLAVTKVEQAQQLEKAIDQVFQVDSLVLVEKGIRCRELEFALMGNERVSVFPPAEVHTGGQFLDYRSKYGAHALDIEAVAKLPENLKIEGMQLAEKVYRAVGCKGFARIDFFLDSDNIFWFNEVNPIPGCTPTSQYPLVWEAHCGKNAELVNKLIILGLHRHRMQSRLSVNV